MNLRPIAALLISSISVAQLPPAAAQQQPQRQAPATTVTVPPGTLVPLTLVSPIHHKSSKPGDTVRAQVAFPITVGDQIAIPAGTYVEGVIAPPPPKVKGKKPANQPNIAIHFTRLLYANGYTVSLDAINTAVLTPIPALPNLPPVNESPTTEQTEYAQLDQPRAHGPSADLDYAPAAYEPGPQYPYPYQPPVVTDPYSHAGPTTKELVAFTVGPIAFLTAIFLAFHFAGPHGDYLIDAAGWQFQMTLQNPLALNISSVNAAAATPTK